MIRVLIVILWAATAGYAQVQVTGGFEQDTIPYGQTATFTLSVESSADEEILAVQRVFLDSVYSALQTFKSNPNDTTGNAAPELSDFELIDVGQWQILDDDPFFSGEELKWTVSTVGSKKLYENTFTFKFWDPGINVVLVPPVIVNIAGAQEQIYDGVQASVFMAPPPGVEVASLDSLEIEPIKPILTEAKNISDFLIYIYILGALLLVGIASWLFVRWQKNKEIVPEPVIEKEVYIPAHTKALSALSTLREEQLWQKGEVKAYQSKLTFIIREYLENRYDVPALESTTEEIVQNISKANLNMSDVDSLKRILQVADLVKFAKAKPDESIHESFMNEAEGFVKRTKSLSDLQITPEAEADTIQEETTTKKKKAGILQQIGNGYKALYRANKFLKGIIGLGILIIVGIKFLFGAAELKDSKIHKDLNTYLNSEYCENIQSSAQISNIDIGDKVDMDGINWVDVSFSYDLTVNGVVDKIQSALLYEEGFLGYELLSIGDCELDK